MTTSPRNPTGADDPTGASGHDAHRVQALDDDWVDAFEAADVAAADRARIDEGADLMAVASAALARVCAARLRQRCGKVSGSRVVLLVGAGNNGGDALLAGAALRARGVGVTALLCAPGHHEQAGEALRRAGGRLVQVARRDDDTGDDHAGAGSDHVLAAAVGAGATAPDLVVDGLLGIGSRGAARDPGARLLAHLARPDVRPASVVACDLPSGLDPGTGLAHGPVLAADVTVTFGAAKPGLLLPWARASVGRLDVVDLGLRPHLPDVPALRLLRSARPDAVSPLLRRTWPWPWRAADKYARGVLGVAAGDSAYPGAAVLVARAAVTAGTGMVRLVPPEDAPEVGRLVLAAVPEVVVQPLADVGRVQAWVLGPGTGGGPDARAEQVLAGADEPAVVDAGALTVLARLLDEDRVHRPGRLLLTPHAGELARLLAALGCPAPEPGSHLRDARAAAARTGATVLLKGPDTLVVAPEGTAVVVPGGPPALATAGAGDVLAGVAGSLLAAGLGPVEAGVLAAHVHAVAAHRAGRLGPLRASGVADALSGVLAGAHPDSWDDG